MRGALTGGALKRPYEQRKLHKHVSMTLNSIGSGQVLHIHMYIYIYVYRCIYIYVYICMCVRSCRRTPRSTTGPLGNGCRSTPPEAHLLLCICIYIYMHII